jgi:hypothetical protein
MPSEHIANDIRNSLAPGESYQDFAYLFDTLFSLRQSTTPNPLLNEKISGALLCVFFPDKPQSYISAMQSFRLRFSGVSSNSALQAEFQQSVTPEAISLTRMEDVIWEPERYFVTQQSTQGFQQSY